MALSHIVMHLVLCNSASRAKTQADVPVRVTVLDKVNHHVVDQSVRVARSGAADGTAEFDIPWGLYAAQAQLHTGRITCSGVQFFSVLANHDRELTMKLQDGNVGTRVPTIIYGDVPAEFSYVEPQIVLFGKDTQCDQPVGTPVAAEIDQQDDDQAYYALVYPTAALMQSMPVTPAIRLKDSSGGYHYLRMPKNFISFSHRMPGLNELDVKDELVQFVAGKPEDTLLCMRGYETTTEMH